MPSFVVLVLVLLLELQSQDAKLATADEFPNLAKIVLPAARQQARVVGGEATTIGKLGGFLVALRYNDDFICGGSLVADTIVVSAAHCFDGRAEKQNWNVEGGVTSLSENGSRVPVKDYLTSAAYTEDAMHMDVSVLKLERPLVGPNIHPVALCDSKLTEGLLLTVSGWGLTDPSGNVPVQTVRSVTVPVIRKSSCKRIYKTSIRISESMFCASVLGGKDACTFDSGGPLVYETPQKQKQLCGIVSFGISCASPKYPGVYTDVNYVKPFILSAIKALDG